MTKTSSSAEADAHVARALEHIEAAQRELERACQELSPIIGGAPQWKRISALYDRVRLGWYWLHGWAMKHRGRLDLDVLGRPALAKTEEPRPFLMHLADTKATRLSRHWACPEHGPVTRTADERCPSCGRVCYSEAPPDVDAALAPPSVQPASERPNATGPPGAEALAKSDVASDSSSQGGE